MEFISMSRLALWFFALGGATGVLAGAFGAHALEGRLDPEQIETFELAARYQLFHSLALGVIGSWADHRASDPVIAVIAMALGTILFSGSLYLLSLSQQTVFAMITPAGGLLLIVGWLAFAWHLQKNSER